MDTDKTQKLEATQRLPTIDEPVREGDFGEVLKAGAPLPWRVTDETPVRIEDANGEAITRIFHHQTFDHKQVAQQIVDAVNGQSTPAVAQFDQAVIETLKAEKRELEAKLAAAHAEIEALKASKPVQVKFIVEKLHTSDVELEKAGKLVAGLQNEGWTIVYENMKTVVLSDRLEHWYKARLVKDADDAPATPQKTAAAPAGAAQSNGQSTALVTVPDTPQPDDINNTPYQVEQTVVLRDWHEAATITRIHYMTLWVKTKRGEKHVVHAADVAAVVNVDAAPVSNPA